jgi:hypothetical protein
MEVKNWTQLAYKDSRGTLWTGHYRSEIEHHDDYPDVVAHGNYETDLS